MSAFLCSSLLSFFEITQKWSLDRYFRGNLCDNVKKISPSEGDFSPTALLKFTREKQKQKFNTTWTRWTLKAVSMTETSKGYFHIATIILLFGK